MKVIINNIHIIIVIIIIILRQKYIIIVIQMSFFHSYMFCGKLHGSLLSFCDNRFQTHFITNLVQSSVHKIIDNYTNMEIKQNYFLCFHKYMVYSLCMCSEFNKTS